VDTIYAKYPPSQLGCHTRISKTSSSRIDQILASPNLIRHSTNHSTISSFSDHLMVVVEFSDEIKKPVNSTTSNRKCVKPYMVAPAANNINRLIDRHFPPHKEYPPGKIASKMEILKRELPSVIIKSWRDSQRKLKVPLMNSHREVTKITKAHQRAKNANRKKNLFDSLLEKQKEYSKLLSLWTQQASDRRIIKHISEDGKCSGDAIKNSRTRHKISLSTEEGDIKSAFHRDYVNIYSKKDINVETLNQMIKNVKFLSGDSLAKVMATLESEVTPQEVIEQIRSLKHGKASGTDGIPHELCLEHGNKLLPILLPIYRNLSNPGIEPPPSYGQLLTVLIPKIDKPANTADYRPISLVNSDYKILAKVWAKRLGLVLSEIIGHHQKGFVPSRDGRTQVISNQALMDYI